MRPLPCGSRDSPSPLRPPAMERRLRSGSSHQIRGATIMQDAPFGGHSNFSEVDLLLLLQDRDPASQLKSFVGSPPGGTQNAPMQMPFPRCDHGPSKRPHHVHARGTTI